MAIVFGFGYATHFALIAPGGVGGEPFAAGEIAARFRVRIAQADAGLASALDDGQADIAELEDVGVIGGVGLQLAVFRKLLCRLPDAARSASAVGQIDCVRAFVQPVQAGYGEPAVRSFERRFIIGAPLRIADPAGGERRAQRREYRGWQRAFTSVWRNRLGPCRRCRAALVVRGPPASDSALTFFHSSSAWNAAQFFVASSLLLWSTM